jgi:acetyl-CoA acetyltransferase
MNYDLAMMALEGLARAPITIRSVGNQVTIEGSSASLKELARLLLLLSGDSDETVELQPKVHLTNGSAGLQVRVEGSG